MVGAGAGRPGREAGRHHPRQDRGDRAEPRTGTAGRADRLAGGRRRRHREHHRDRHRRPRHVHPGTGGQRRPAHPGALRAARAEHRRLRHRHRPDGGRLRRRRVRRARWRHRAAVPRRGADRGAEGAAGHPVRAQYRRRRDLDHHQAPVAGARGPPAPAPRQRRASLGRRHPEPACRRCGRAALQRAARRDRWLAARRRDRRSPRRRQDRCAARGAGLGHQRRHPPVADLGPRGDGSPFAADHRHRRPRSRHRPARVSGGSRALPRPLRPTGVHRRGRQRRDPRLRWPDPATGARLRLGAGSPPPPPGATSTPSTAPRKTRPITPTCSSTPPTSRTTPPGTRSCASTAAPTGSIGWRGRAGSRSAPASPAWST